MTKDKMDRFVRRFEEANVRLNMRLTDTNLRAMRDNYGAWEVLLVDVSCIRIVSRDPDIEAIAATTVADAALDARVNAFEMKMGDVPFGWLLWLAAGAGEDLYMGPLDFVVKLAYAAVEPHLVGCPSSCRPIP